MGLKVDQITLKSFRNYKDFESERFGDFNIFIGPNGVGKTNLIEAIQLVTSLDSFRNPKWDELIHWGSQNASVKASLSEGQRNLEIKMEINDNKRRYLLNGKGKRVKDIRGNAPTVLFCPNDLDLAKGPSGIRRDALDGIGSQISETYYDLKGEYQQTLKQKAALLQSDCVDRSLLESWNESLVAFGSTFVKHRINLYLTFRQILVGTGLEMVNDLFIDVSYIPSWAGVDLVLKEEGIDHESIATMLREKLCRLNEAEIASKRCLCGPHRDEIVFEINGHDARKFASQGQQRMISLIWKIAEMKTISQICNIEPLLLLDDVMSELDSTRRESLLDGICDKTQVFITATDTDYFSKEILERASVFEIG